MSGTDKFVIRELTEALLGDYLAFFDHDAFADNPGWASCYCHFPQAPHQLKDWGDRTAQENRAAVSQLIRNRQMHGYLAYFEDKPVGWCNAGPRTGMTILPDEEEAQAGTIGSIVCFVVAKPYRGQGVARQLLQAACAGFQRQKLKIAEAYPRKEAHDDASNHYGPLAVYLAAGFEPFREQGNSLIVRKNLS